MCSQLPNCVCDAEYPRPMTDAMQVKEALIERLLHGSDDHVTSMALRREAADALRAPSPAALDPVTVERCANIADDFAAYEQTIVDRAHADEALSDGGRKSVLAAANSRQITAEQIAHDIRAMIGQPSGNACASSVVTSTDRATLKGD
jgi:hypothetical protein